MLKCSVVPPIHKLDYDHEHDHEHEQEDEHEFVIRLPRRCVVKAGASSFVIRASSFSLLRLQRRPETPFHRITDNRSANGRIRRGE